MSHESETRIFDNHMHLTPTGQGAEAAKIFEKAGGTALVLTHLPPRGKPVSSSKDYKQAFEATLDLAQNVRGVTKLKVYVALGPYPVELLHLSESIGLEKSVEIQKDAMDMAGRYASEGKVIALGEIGRPHFPVDKAVIEACNEVLLHGMKVAKEVGCAVVLHTEVPDATIMEELAKMADTVGLRREKVVKHYCPPLVRKEDNHGLMPSIVAREDAILKAIEQGSRFFMETDYLDDPRRPGAVLGPATIPKKTVSMIRDGKLSVDAAREIHEEWPRRIYGIET